MATIFRIDECEDTPNLEEVKEEVKECEDASQKELERTYLSIEKFNLDWNKLLYNNENEDPVDWNKLIYGEEQCSQFFEDKIRQVFRHELLDYMFKPPNERSAQEQYFLKEAGYSVYGNDGDGEDLCSPRVPMGDEDMREVICEEPCQNLKSRDILYNV
jgi:hypothetical protein